MTSYKVRRIIATTAFLAIAILTTSVQANTQWNEPMKGEIQANTVFPGNYVISDLIRESYKFRFAHKVVVTGSITKQVGAHYLFTDKTGSLPIQIDTAAFQGATILPSDLVEVVAKYKTSGETPLFQAISVSKIK